MKKYAVRAVAQFTRVTKERLLRLAGLVETGAVKVHVDRVFPLEKTAEALGYLEKGKPRGKVIIKIK